MNRRILNPGLVLIGVAALAAAPGVMAQKATVTIVGSDGYVATVNASSGLSGTQSAMTAGLPDGSYTYEVRPNNGNRTRSGDAGEPAPDSPGNAFGLTSKPEVEYGYFTIKNGVMVDPNLVEIPLDSSAQ